MALWLSTLCTDSSPGNLCILEAVDWFKILSIIPYKIPWIIYIYIYIYQFVCGCQCNKTKILGTQNNLRNLCHCAKCKQGWYQKLRDNSGWEAPQKVSTTSPSWSRDKNLLRLGCSGFYPVWSWKLSRVLAAQQLDFWTVLVISVIMHTFSHWRHYHSIRLQDELYHGICFTTVISTCFFSGQSFLKHTLGFVEHNNFADREYKLNTGLDRISKI